MSTPAKIPQQRPQLTGSPSRSPRPTTSTPRSRCSEVPILLSERTMYSVVIEEGLRAEDFYRERHRVIFAAMLGLYERSEPIDTVTVTDALRAAGTLREAGRRPAGGRPTCSPGRCRTSRTWRQYAQIVRDTALLRRLLNTTYEIQSSVLDQHEPARELVDRAEQAMLEVAHDERTKDFRSISTLLNSELDVLHELSVAGESLTGTPTGFNDLDAMTGGMQRGKPDRHRRAAVDGQELPGQQHRRERRDQPPQAGRPVQPRRCPEAELARPLHRLAGRASRATISSKGRVPESDLAEDHPGHQPKLAGAAPLWIDELGRHRHPRDPGQGHAAATCTPWLHPTTGSAW